MQYLPGKLIFEAMAGNRLFVECNYPSKYNHIIVDQIINPWNAVISLENTMLWNVQWQTINKDDSDIPRAMSHQSMIL